MVLHCSAVVLFVAVEVVRPIHSGFVTVAAASVPIDFVVEVVVGPIGLMVVAVVASANC